MKPWHFLNICVDKIETNFDLHNSVCIISSISQEQNLIFWILDMRSPVSNMASSRSEENVNLNYFTNWWCHSYGETCNFLNLFVRTKLADVIANDC